MNSFANRQLRSCLAALALGACLGSPLCAKGKRPAPPADDGSGINLPIAIGHEAKGVKLPYIDAKGRLQMNFTIGVVHRTDEVHLEMASLLIQTYDDEGKPDMVFDLPTSLYDVKTHILTSDHPVRIRRSDFDLTGDTMEFNTTTRQGVLRGSVRMLIFNRDEMSTPSKTPSPSPTP